MISEVMTAITAKNTGSALAAALTGGLYNTHLPQNSPFPCGIFFVVSAVPAEEFGRAIETVVVQFSLWDRPDNNSPATLYNLQNLLTALFDFCQLTVAGWNFIAMKRRDQRVGRDEAFENLWVLHVTYEISISK